ncbi:MAG: hypothetical protein QOD87_408 [Pseudonocardiales bacterium]|jgi:hypothetical protein|nr:hypothetical protein [Pseudonocardiales bacterium]
MPGAASSSLATVAVVVLALVSPFVRFTVLNEGHERVVETQARRVCLSRKGNEARYRRRLRGPSAASTNSASDSSISDANTSASYIASRSAFKPKYTPPS